MANALKSRMNELMSAEIERNPDIRDGKRRIGYALIAWGISRLLFHVVDLICVSQGFWAFSSANLIGLAVGVIFALCVYSGVKLFALLPIIGGFWMLAQTCTSGWFEILLSDEYYAVIRIYAGAFLLAALVQITAFLFVVLNRKSRAYFDACARVNTAVTNEGKSL